MSNTNQGALSSGFSKTVIWYNRVILALVTLLFIFIGLRNSIHPAESAALSGISLNTPTAMSVGRVSMGGFPLGFALIIFSCLLSVDTLLVGIRSVFIMIVTVTIMRIIGYSIDGAAPFIVPEIVVTVLSAVGLFLETRRRNMASIH